MLPSVDGVELRTACRASAKPLVGPTKASVSAIEPMSFMFFSTYKDLA